MRSLKFVFFFLLPLSSFAQRAALPSFDTLRLTSASGREIAAERGEIRVPEDRNDPASTSIPIAFVRLKSSNPNPLPPVFYLEGGPGSSSTWMADNPRALDRWAPLLDLCDVIVYDQRGTGASAERLFYVTEEPLSPNLFLTEENFADYYQSMLPKALAYWQRRGIALRGYNTLESAKDLDALRVALGYEKITLLGFSYGTHLGQTYLKYYGDKLERAILAGVEGLDETFKLPLRMDAQLRKLGGLLAADPDLSAEIPDLVALYERVAAKLAAEPVTITIQNRLNGQPFDVKVGKFGLDHVLARDLGDASDLPVIPRMLYEIDRGDYSSLGWFVRKRYGGYGIHTMSMATDIASGLSAPRRAAIEQQASVSLFGNVLNIPYFQAQATGTLPDLGDDFRTAFTSEVPTLLLSGTLDMNTPPYQAERLRWSLPNADHIIVKNAGHEQILTHPQIGEAIGKFLRGLDVAGITAAHPPLRFVPLTGTPPGEWVHPALE